MSDKGPEARIYKELLELSMNKMHNSTEKMSKGLEQKMNAQKWP